MNELLSQARARVFASDIRVRDVMTEDVFTLGPQSTLLDMAEALQVHRIRHVPILDEQRRVLGLMTLRDLLAFSPGEEEGLDEKQRRLALEQLPLGDVMRDDRVAAVVTVDPEVPLRAAAMTLSEKKIGCLPVVDEDNHLLGLLTEGDFVKFFMEAR